MPEEQDRDAALAAEILRVTRDRQLLQTILTEMSPILPKHAAGALSRLLRDGQDIRTDETGKQAG